jgi:putative membrane protein
MALDALLAALHHICVFGLFVILAAEMTLVHPGISAETVMRVVRIDGMYGLLAGLALVAGGLRVFYGAKGAEFYTHNPVFWIKLGLFLVIGLLSILPTLNYFRWRKALRENLNALPDAAAINTTRKIIHIQLALLFLLPILAALMARGIGMGV